MKRSNAELRLCPLLPLATYKTLLVATRPTLPLLDDLSVSTPMASLISSTWGMSLSNVLLYRVV
jgi:hypothetical protein